MYKPEDLNSKIIEMGSFIEMIQPGNKIFLTSGPAIPQLVTRELTSSEKLRNFDLEIIQLFSLGFFLNSSPCVAQNYRLKTFRSGETISENICEGGEDFIPANLVEIPYIFGTKALEIDIAVISTSPPDRRGFMSLGVAIDVAATVIKNASIVIAEVNPNVPVTYGETSIHVDQIDYAIMSEEPLLERERKPFNPVQERIGWHVSNLIQDGSTVVLHVGRIFEAIAVHLMAKRNLGVLTNVVSDWIIDLVEAGAVSVDRRRESGGQISTSYCYGSKELYDYVDHNQLFGFYPVAKLANPLYIKDIPKLISIMNVEKIDITAARTLVYSGDDLISGYESKFNFAAGAAFSGSGKVIFVLNSIDQNGESNIVISFDRDNERVRSTLSAARYIVTEYGVASLFGKSIRERALSLIEIAHPDHRETLFNRAKEQGYIYPDQIYRSIAANYPTRLETVKTFKDGLELKIRPVKASDEDMMRRLFYKFSDESKYYRYFTHVRVMPHKNMQKYLSVDYDKIVSVVAVQQTGNFDRIVAEARYAAYPSGDAYEMAFLVDEEYQGRGIATFMANYLIKIARERGIKKLVASVLSQNRKMLQVFDKLSVKPAKQYDGETVELEFIL
ncbi:MAG TPA: GNAT family N-acetyltransferase [Spirochaetota bacterium]|nr:GNAT family N-acetyltransferase [Spirochaetota bacterium]HPJ33354.1 GNAT family N-acetyltransferase [Spirochaetota bacterium]